MKQALALIVFSICMFSSALANEIGFMSHEIITISFTYGDRTGYYTGTTLNGIPDGYGCFETQNSSGNPWLYIGNFKNGIFEGEGICIWPEGSDSMEGIYENGNMVSGVSRTSEITQTFEGEFTSDERNDLIGKAYSSDGTLVFDGNIVDGRFEEGTLYNADGTIAAVGMFGAGFETFINDLTFYNIFE